ncbi:pilus assembly FimT family protein [Sulfurirhabdus autotrophica]|uniref:General secretion pathway protein G n=1 Tax=Sulfurirhabdus autotrophica TaxID=1706046 RepID=A0A4R3Y1P4_9PROT|nr:prepilin-type N-terminal cleavage/methylation domain-containing protein [Sulfurirhabdus autotrophica]TCV85211.1 general secretion pathway protein G [Sulfurirhabdus autotrophica]
MFGLKQELQKSVVGVSKHQGFSLFELMVISVLISILAIVLINRLLYYQELAEKADMEYKATELQSGLRLRMAKLLIEGRAQEYSKLALENPFDWVENKPGNYVGQFKNANPKQLPAGSWYYDLTRHTLVYLVRNGNHFQSGIAGEKQVRYQVKLIRNPPGVGVDQPFASIKLVLIESYQWF